MHSLPIFLRLNGRPVILLGDGPAAAAKRRLLERAGAIIMADEAQDAQVAIVALDDPAAAEEASDRLRRRGILINAPDRPELCDFTIPAIIDRDPVIISIGTGGASAGLAKALRGRLETLLPAALGSLARQLYAARDQLRTRWPDPQDRRHALDEAFEGPLSPLKSHSENAVANWLINSHLSAGQLVETVVITSPDPEELTLRAARLLGQADRIFHPKDMPAAILNRARADAERILDDRMPDTLPPGLTVHLVWKAEA